MKTPIEQGRVDAAQWKAPECPFDATSEAASQWADGLLEGRAAFSWNTRNIIMIGMTCRYVSEAIDQNLGIAVAKSIFHLAGEAAALFRLGFVINSHSGQLPVLNVEGWRDVAKCVNRAMQGRDLDGVELGHDPSWIERLAFLIGRDFMLEIIGHPAPSNPKPDERLQVEMAELIAWMGGNVDRYEQFVRP